MPKKCHKCGTEWMGQTTPGTKADCQVCLSYLHCCMNCTSFDRKRDFCSNSYAPRVYDKEKFNDCDEFKFKES